MFNRRALELKERLAKGGHAAGMWLWIPSPTVCEIVAGAGLDFVVIDGEHAPFNPETLQHMHAAFKGTSTVTLIRVPWNNAVMIKQALDLGFDGVLVPQVNTVAEAQAAVDACRYPPVGDRGFGPNRASNFGRDMADYKNLANDSIVCWIQVEKLSGADEIERMVEIEGIDGVFVGRWDMSGSIGRLGDIDCDEIWGACNRIFAAAHSKNIPTGNALMGSGTFARQKEMGNRLIVVGIDALSLVGTIDELLDEYSQKVLGRPRDSKEAGYYSKKD